MSAWIVTRDHVDVLVQAMIVEGLADMSQATTLGRMLWQENHDSVNYRYREDEPCPEYTFTGIEAPLDPVVVIRACDCYEYQSCEHPEWDTSVPHDLVHTLRDKLAAQIGRTQEQLRGSREWSNLPWGIDHREQAVAR